MKIEDVMSKKVVSANPDDTFKSVIEKLAKKNITGMPVVKKGKVVGIITQSDIIKNIDIFSGINDTSDVSSIKKFLKGKDISRDRIKKVNTKKVKDFMNKDVIMIDVRGTLHDAAELITTNDIDRLPVVSKGRLIGIITKKDIIKAIEKLDN